MRAPLSRVEITGPTALVDAARQAQDDLRAVGTIVGELEFVADESATELRVSAELAPVEDAPGLTGARPRVSEPAGV